MLLLSVFDPKKNQQNQSLTPNECVPQIHCFAIRTTADLNKFNALCYIAFEIQKRKKRKTEHIPSVNSTCSYAL